MKTASFTLLATFAALTTPALAADPKVLAISQGVDASTLDPAQVSARNEANMLDNLFGTLYKIGADGKITPVSGEVPHGVRGRQEVGFYAQ